MPEASDDVQVVLRSTGDLIARSEIVLGQLRTNHLDLEGLLVGLEVSRAEAK